MDSVQASELGLSKSLLHTVLNFSMKKKIYNLTTKNNFLSLTSSWAIKLDSKFIKSSKDSDLIFAFNPDNKNSDYYNKDCKILC